MKNLLRDTEVAALFGVGRATVWLWARTGILPRPVAIGPRVKRWRVTELHALIDGLRPAGDEASQ